MAINTIASFIQKCRSPTSRGSLGARRHLENLDEGELFMELIRDVANELNIDVLCHKILVNVGLLTHADRGSLFLAKGSSSSNRYLVAKLFDVTQDTGTVYQPFFATNSHKFKMKRINYILSGFLHCFMISAFSVILLHTYSSVIRSNRYTVQRLFQLTHLF